MSKKELLLSLQEEVLFGRSSQKRQDIRKQMTTNSMEVDKPRQDDSRHYSWPSMNPTTLKRRNSKAPNFPAIEETGETDATLSPDPLGKKDEVQLQGKLSRPTTLAFKPNSSGEKTSKQWTGTSGSPKVKSKSIVSFADIVAKSAKTKIKKK